MTDMDDLVATFGAAPGRAFTGARRVLEVAAAKIKKDMARDFEAAGGQHARHVHRAVDYQVNGLRAEIGVNKDKPQGALGNVLAFGTVNNAPLLDIARSMRAELPHAEKALADEIAKALEQ